MCDVAIYNKALSPAINDPTTAVLALDQIHRLLMYVGKRGLDAFAGTTPQHEVNNRHNVGEALAGTGAGRQNVVPALFCFSNRIFQYLFISKICLSKIL